MKFEAGVDVRHSATLDDRKGLTSRSRAASHEIGLLTLGLSAALLLPVIVGSASFSAMRALAVFVIATLSIIAGRSIRLCLNMPSRAGFSASFDIVVGFCATSVLHWFVTATLNTSAVLALPVDAVVIAAIAFVAHVRARRQPLHSMPGSSFGGTLADVAILLIISALVTLWTRDALGAVREAHISGVLRVWEDFLLQAAEIKYQQNYPAFHGQSMFLAGTPQPFYHRASYALSAIYAAMAHDPALDTSVYFWMPTGIVLLGAGAYGLGCAIGGRMAGVVSALALFLLPDASMYGLHNGYFAFHWLIQVAPGTGYALALALIALALYALGTEAKRLAPVLVGAGLTALAALFRVHIAIPAVATFGVLTLLAWRPSRQSHRIVLVIALAAVGVLGVIACEHIELAPHFLSGHKDGLKYIEAVHLATPTAYEGVYQRWTAGISPLAAGAVGYVLLLVAELGMLLPLLFIFAVAQAKASFDGWRLAIAPWLLIAVHTAIVFLMPTASDGDITEWSHRSFPLVYAVPLVLIAAYSTNAARRAARGRASMLRASAVSAALVAIASTTVPWHFGKHAQYGSLRDGPTACRTPISPYMFQVADFIRRHAKPDDKLLLSDNDPKAVGVGLTGLQEFVSREKLYAALGGRVAKLAAERADANRGLAQIRDYAELQAFARHTNVRWYVLRRQDMPLWPEDLIRHAAFTSGDISVFDLQG